MYIYEHHNRMVVKCHNCGVSTSLLKLLQEINPELAKEYVYENFKKPNNIKAPELITPPLENHKAKAIDHLEPLPTLSASHFARKYVESRKIPLDKWHHLFYCDDFKAYMDINWPAHGKKLNENESRLVWFMTNFEEYDTVVCGRAFDDSALRYMKIRVQGKDGDRKIFGLKNADLTLKSDLHVTEGELDSLFLPNAVACGDSSIRHLGDAIRKDLHIVPILIYDNEPRNKEICAQINQAIKSGHLIVIWPDSMPGKDINAMILAGMTQQEVLDVINDNTYCGLEAQLEFTKWRK